MKPTPRYTGLTEKEVEASRERHGKNVLTSPEKEPLWKQFLEKFSDPLIIILLVAGVLSIGISCYEFFGLGEGGAVFFEPVGIFVAILLATGLAFFFEQRANEEFALLNKVNNDEPVEVIRGGNTTIIKRSDVVVGDIVILPTGAEVPADGELLEAVNLSVDESSLTGEPICRKSTVEADFDADATFPTNHALKGTKVMEGHGILRVTAVGDHTEQGKVFEDVQIDSSVKTPLNEQLDGLSDLITKLSYGFAAVIIVAKLMVYFSWAPLAWTLLVPTFLFFGLVIKKFDDWSATACIVTVAVFFIVLIGGVYGLHQVLLPEQNLSFLLAYTLQTLMIAVTLIVVAVPEGLPMAVTLSLAYSMNRMLKTNNLVRKMHACETMGATTVICTDKTGTLTQNKMQISDTQFYGLPQDAALDSPEGRLVTEGMAVNSTAELDHSAKNLPPVPVGNPTEGALLLWLHAQGIDYRELRTSCETLEELPFSTERKYMATVVREASGRRVLFVKGAPEIVLSLCAGIGGGVTKETVEKQLLTYQNQAMRTLGFAAQVLADGDAAIDSGRVTATGLTFLGLAAIADPVRIDVPDAVKECLDAGIRVKIVTGDTPGTAKEIGRRIGLWDDACDTEEALITGPEFAALSDEELRNRIGSLKIIARARPMDKKRLVETLQKLGEVVAVTGDGTNDAPALKTAHVGLSMGDGTSVAKEASDITIIDNSFSSIGRAVMWGRSLYQNIQRFLLFQLTVNVAACFLVLAGAFMGTESPLTVTQMLWVNLIMDTFGAMALASLPPTERVMHDKPRDRKAFIINGPMAREIFGVGGFFFLLTLGFLYIFQHAQVNCMADLLHLKLGAADGLSAYEQTLLFSIFVWTHFWYMFCARGFETGRSALHFKGCKGFGIITLVIILGQVVIVEGLYPIFDVTPMRLDDWLIIVVLSSLVLWIREMWHAVAGRK